jgi:flavin-binding protein dodecin
VGRVRRVDVTQPAPRHTDASSADRASRPRREHVVSSNTYGVSEVVGSSSESIEDAIRGAVAKAGQTLRHLDWFEVTEIRGHLVDGDIGHFQVGLKLGFRIED